MQTPTEDERRALATRERYAKHDPTQQHTTAQQWVDCANKRQTVPKSTEYEDHYIHLNQKHEFND